MGVKMIMLLIVAGGKAQDGLRNNSANFFKKFITRRWVSGQVHDGDVSNRAHSLYTKPPRVSDFVAFRLSARKFKKKRSLSRGIWIIW